MANGAIITSAHCAQVPDNSGQGKFFIYNQGTSQKNPITWKRYGVGLLEASKYHEYNRKIRNVEFQFIGPDKRYHLGAYLKNDLPMMLLKAYYQIPFIGSDKMKLNLMQLQKIEKARDDLMHLFRFFIQGNWEFANENIYLVMKCMSPEEVVEFNSDCTSFEWMSFIRNYMQGIAIYALKEDKVEP